MSGTAVLGDAIHRLCTPPNTLTNHSRNTVLVHFNNRACYNSKVHIIVTVINRKTARLTIHFRQAIPMSFNAQPNGQN